MVKGTLSFDESRIGFDILKFHKTFYAMLGLLRSLRPILQNVFIGYPLASLRRGRRRMQITVLRYI